MKLMYGLWSEAQCAISEATASLVTVAAEGFSAASADF